MVVVNVLHLWNIYIYIYIRNVWGYQESYLMYLNMLYNCMDQMELYMTGYVLTYIRYIVYLLLIYS